MVPVEGEDVIISSRWRMLLDVSPPTLGKVYILGELIFEDMRYYNFTADLVSLRFYVPCLNAMHGACSSNDYILLYS